MYFKVSILYCCQLYCVYCCQLSLCIVVFVLCVLLQLPCVYCCHLMCIYCTMCVLLFLLQMPDCLLEVSIRKVLRPAISTQSFLGFPVAKANAAMVPKIPSCHYMLLMQAFRLKFSSNQFHILLLLLLSNANLRLYFSVSLNS